MFRWSCQHFCCKGRAAFDAIYVINLESRADRRDFVVEQLLRVRGDITCGGKVPVIHYPAVVGKSLDAARLERAGFITRLGRLRLEAPVEQKVWGMDLNYGAVGCALSHINLWLDISRRMFRRALVLEDDSIIPEHFLEAFGERILHVPADWELVYLSGLDTAKRGHLLQVAEGVRYVPQMHRTTNCYMVSASGCSRLLRECVPLTYQLDTQMTLKCNPHPESREPYVVTPRCYTMHPPLVVQATRFGSDIQESNPADPISEEQGRLKEANLPSV